MTDTTDDLVRERRGQVMVVRLNRPDARNALTPGLLAATGERAFCAGMDLRSFAGGEQMGTGPNESAYDRLIKGEVTVPLVGAANGTAVAGGLELLLGCDVIVASSEAQFGLPEVKRGLFPAGRGTFIGTRVPLSIALEMTLTGDSITAARAYELGLVNAVVAPGDVFATALAFAERIADNAPLGLAACKELVRLGVSDAALAAEKLEAWQHTVFSSADAKEGATAFVEKRKPVWQGR